MAAYAAIQNDICLINFHSKVARNNNQFGKKYPKIKGGFES